MFGFNFRCKDTTFLIKSYLILIERLPQYETVCLIIYSDHVTTQQFHFDYWT